MLPIIPAPFWASAAPGSFRLRAGTRVAYADPALAAMVERFCVEVARRTGVWCEPARATREAAPGAPSIRVELARDAELDALPPADGISPAAAGGADERHALSIEGGGEGGGADRVVVRGVEPVGAARGLTTLLQLLATATPEDDGAIVLPAAHIVDAPRYAWRSQSLDLADRSFSVADLKRVIDLLVLYKVNVLHVRLDDDLTASELAQLLAYAQARFVTLLAEFSTTETGAAAAAHAVPVMVSPVDHAYFDVPDAATWSDPSADWSDHHDRLAAHRRLWEQDELTYFISSAIVTEAR